MIGVGTQWRSGIITVARREARRIINVKYVDALIYKFAWRLSEVSSIRNVLAQSMARTTYYDGK